MLARRSSARGQAAALAQSAPVFAALGDQTRLRLVARLGHGRTAVHRPSHRPHERHASGGDQALAGVGGRRYSRGACVEGREHLWQLEAAPLDEARRSLELMSQRWDEALGRLKAAVEED